MTMEQTTLGTEQEDRLERLLWRIEGGIDRCPRLSRWFVPLRLL